MILSIIVPVYNVKPYLKQCVNSILGQDFKDLEIILVDDGSTDGCDKICDEYLGKDERIHVLHKVNGGPVSARKTGLLAAQGEYITFVDGDDWIEPNMYANMYNYIKMYACECVISGYYNNDGDKQTEVCHAFSKGLYVGTKLTYLYHNVFDDNNFFAWGIFPSLCDMIVKRDLLEKILYEEDEQIVIGDDVGIVIYILMNTKSVYVLDQCLYHYRQREGSLVHYLDNTNNELKQMIALNKFVLSYIGDDDIMKRKWRAYMLFIMYQRADYLYSGIGDLDYLFPFTDVKKGSDIIIYGAGVYGKRLYAFIKRTKFCNICGWIDINAKALQKQGYEVEHPDSLKNYQCKTVVLALSYAHVRNNVYEELKKKYPEKNIHTVNVKEIFSKKTAIAFGLE